MTIQYKAVMTCISANDVSGLKGSHNVIISGKRKADGPSYLTEVLQGLAAAADGPDIMDYRLGVLSIHTHGHFFHYVCDTRVTMADSHGVTKSFRDSIHVFIDRRTIEEIPAEE